MHGVVETLPWGRARGTTTKQQSPTPEAFSFLQPRMPTPSRPCLVQRSSHAPKLPRSQHGAAAACPIHPSSPGQLGAAGSHAPPRHMPGTSLAGRHSHAGVGRCAGTRGPRTLFPTTTGSSCLVLALNYHSQGLRPCFQPLAGTGHQCPSSAAHRRLLGFTRRSKVFLQHPRAAIHISWCLIHFSRCPQSHSL